MTVSTEKFQTDKNQSCFSQTFITSDCETFLSNNSVQILYCMKIIFQFISTITKPKRSSRDNLSTLVFSYKKVFESLRWLMAYSIFKDLSLKACWKKSHIFYLIIK